MEPTSEISNIPTTTPTMAPTPTAAPTPTPTPGISTNDTSPEGCDFAWPLQTGSYYLTSFFGARKDPFTGLQAGHGGTDIAMGRGTPILAAQDGVVITSTTNGGGYGQYIQIKHDNGVRTLYAHCSQLLVSVGERVVKGQRIALVGDTGRATGPHLHFEVIIDGAKVESLTYLPQNMLLNKNYNWSTSSNYKTMLTRLGLK
jgi:murein DD-endopeptidase MepM/ murein hydrolase activator NlpD